MGIRVPLIVVIATAMFVVSEVGAVRDCDFMDIHRLFLEMKQLRLKWNTLKSDAIHRVRHGMVTEAEDEMIVRNVAIDIVRVSMEMLMFERRCAHHFRPKVEGEKKLPFSSVAESLKADALFYLNYDDFINRTIHSSM
jgi:hypothetical protein